MLIFFISGLIYSSLLFVVASGLVLTFGALRIINLAHGSLYMLAAYIAYSLLRLFPDQPLYFFLVLLIIFLILASLGCLIEVVLLRRIYRSDHIFQLVLTFALIWVISDVVRGGWGVGLKAVPKPGFLGGSITVLGYSFPEYNLLIFAASVIVGFGLWVLLYRTNAGIVIRAITNDPDMANSVGINVPMWRTLVFSIGCGLAGLGGALAAPWASLGLGMDWKILIDLFIVIVIGGMGSYAGAIIGVLILGQVNAFGILVVPKLALIFGFLAMAIVLLIRPWGLFGRPE